MILKRLKESTDECHRALERQLPLMSPHLSLHAYRQLLRSLLGFYEPLESSLLESPFPRSFLERALFDYRMRRKSMHLTQDLLMMGELPEVLLNLPQCHALPCIDSGARVIGCLYVIEGATLGGRIITKYLHRHLGITESTGGSFYQGYGAQTGSHWLSYCEWAKSRTEASTEPEEIIAAAKETFSCLDAWLFPKVGQQVESQLGPRLIDKVSPFLKVNPQ